MSIRLITWAFDAEIDDHIAKFVLVKLADNANDEGECWPTVRRISQDTAIPERTVTKKLAWLEEQGWIERRRERTEGGHYGVTRYQLPAAPGAADRQHPHAGARASTFSEINRQRSTTPLNPPGQALVRSGNGVMRPNRPTGLMVNRIEAVAWEVDLATAVLDAFNALTGSNPPFTSDGWLKKIVMRIREHPTLDVEGHVEVVRRALARPWWDGPASPAVVYGNETLFEQCLVSNGATKHKRRYGTGVTAGEIGAMVKQLKEQGR